MASVKICDGRSQLYRYDTGVKIELCGCASVTECHFGTVSGLIHRDVVDNICDVPDVALTQAGMLEVYAFSRTADGGVTRHSFRLIVQDRPKPADYIDPPDEVDNLEALAERVAGMIEPGGGGITEETDPTVHDWAKEPEKPSYTAEEVGAIGINRLGDAVNVALAQAKESGEFDGEPGYTPTKGTDYFTEADKAEMVAAVIAALPVYAGEVADV